MSEAFRQAKLGDLCQGVRGVSYSPASLRECVAEDTVTLLRATNIQDGGVVFQDVQVVPEKIVKQEQILGEGDVLVCMSNGSKRLVGKSAAFHAEDGQRYTVGAFCALFKPKPGVDSRFLKALFQGQNYQAAVDVALSGSAINNLKNSDIEGVEIHLPSPATQHRIAEILSTLDAQIAATEALIAKHQQIKAGLMQDLFTRGIGADGKLRPSRAQAPELYRETGIGWVPVGWEVKRLDAVAEVAGGVTLGRNMSGPGTIEVPYLRVANVQDGYLDLGEIKTIRIPDTELGRYRLEIGDVLMNEGGDFDKLGRGAVWEGQIEICLHQNHVFRVRCDRRQMSPHFLALFSESVEGKKYFLKAGKQSTNLASINSTQLKAFVVARPPMEEQQEAVKRFSAQAQMMGQLSAEVNVFQKIKSGLLSDLLTGKVQVLPRKESSHGH